MPSNKPLDEEYWLERAREAYAHAGRMVHPEAKQMMLEIAAGYQRLAQSTEERTGRQKLGSSRSPFEWQLRDRDCLMSTRSSRGRVASGFRISCGPDKCPQLPAEGTAHDLGN